MPSSLTRWQDLVDSGLFNNIYEQSLVTLREFNLLVPTVTVLTDTSSMNPRKFTTRGTASPRQVAEGEAVSPTQFTKELLATLTPARWADKFIITDQDIRSDTDRVQNLASLELGAAFAESVDQNIASLFPNLTGGTIGAGMGTITWGNIMQARALLHQKKVPGPYFCVLGPGQWYHLAYNGGSVSNAFTLADQFNDRLVNQYYLSSAVGGVIFVQSANIQGVGGGTAYGAMYARQALAYDERSPFSIEVARSADRKAWELVANLEYAYGAIRSLAGVQLIGTDKVQ